MSRELTYLRDRMKKVEEIREDDISGMKRQLERKVYTLQLKLCPFIWYYSPYNLYYWSYKLYTTQAQGIEGVVGGQPADHFAHI